jgi:hypothetical protein
MFEFELQVWAVATSESNEHSSRTLRFRCYPEVFNPTYAWQQIEDDQSIPSGLEVRMSLNNQGKQAKIPDTFRLQIWIDEISSFFRMDVHRSTLISDIISNAKNIIFQKLPYSIPSASIAANLPCITLIAKKEPPPLDALNDKGLLEEGGDYHHHHHIEVEETSSLTPHLDHATSSNGNRGGGGGTVSSMMMKKKKKRYVKFAEVEEYRVKETLTVEESSLFHHIDGLHFHINEACIVGLTDEEYDLI